ncbi:MAG: SulP family inorganic anion transporter [Minisyncoccota bacterium]
MTQTSASFLKKIRENWRSGLTVAFISVPLSIALSIASGAGPLPGIITGIWATLIASVFGGSHYNVIGAAGALTTILFTATLDAPFQLGALILPLIAIVTGVIILIIWLVGADRFLYYIPSSVMYGFATGVAILIASSQLFDATGLSALKRTGTFLGDIQLFLQHTAEVDMLTVLTFTVFLVAILLWKHFIKIVPAVIPIAIVGIIFGFLETTFLPSLDFISLRDKFGDIEGVLFLPVAWGTFAQLLVSYDAWQFIIKVSGVVAMIAVLETLITAKIGDKITKTQSSSQRELLGLALANLGSGIMGGLPATGVFIRTGANIKAGATHRFSATLAAIITAIIAFAVLPFFAFLPLVVVAAILVNTALGLIEMEKIREFWHREKPSFFVAMLVVVITVFEDAGLGVLVGALVSLFLFVDRVSHGRFDIILNFEDGTKKESRAARILRLPHDQVMPIVTYSIAGFLGYIDSEHHSANLRHLARANNVQSVIIRLRDLFNLDFEGSEMLAEAVEEFHRHKKQVYVSSANAIVTEQLRQIPSFADLVKEDHFCSKTSDALHRLHYVKKEV